MRKQPFIKGEFYHVYAHAVGDMDLFRSDADYLRFLTTLFVANGKRDISHLDRFYDRNLVSDIRDGKVNIGEQVIDIAGFCFMPNHFHLLLREIKDGNIERTFDAKYLNNDNYIMRVLAYIHLNPKDLNVWKRKEHKYPWSSFQDYAAENRWGKLLGTDFALDYFDSDKNEFKLFTKSARKDNRDLNDRN